MGSVELRGATVIERLIFFKCLCKLPSCMCTTKMFKNHTCIFITYKIIATQVIQKDINYKLIHFHSRGTSTAQRRHSVNANSTHCYY